MNGQLKTFREQLQDSEKVIQKQKVELESRSGEKDGLLKQIADLEKQVANLQQSSHANTSMASIAQESGNMDQGQISNQGTVAVTRNEGLGSQLNISGQGSQLIKKIKQQNIKIRFATNERSQAEVPVPKANLKLKNLNQGGKNFMIKPTSIISNQQFNSVIQAKPKNIPLLVPMTEKEYQQKKEAILSEFEPKL